MNEITLTILQLASVPLLVLLNGFFVAAEFALVKIRDTQLEALVAKGHRRVSNWSARSRMNSRMKKRWSARLTAAPGS